MELIKAIIAMVVVVLIVMYNGSTYPKNENKTVTVSYYSNTVTIQVRHITMLQVY